MTMDIYNVATSMMQFSINFSRHVSIFIKIIKQIKSVNILSVTFLKCRRDIVIPPESASVSEVVPTCEMLEQILKCWNFNFSVYLHVLYLYKFAFQLCLSY